MEPENFRSEASSAQRTHDVEVAAPELNKDVFERKQAVVDRKEAKEELSQVNTSRLVLDQDRHACPPDPTDVAVPRTGAR